MTIVNEIELEKVRPCACGCGKTVTAPKEGKGSTRIYLNGAHRARAQRNRDVHTEAVNLIEKLIDEGVLTAEQAEQVYASKTVTAQKEGKGSTRIYLNGTHRERLRWARVDFHTEAVILIEKLIDEGVLTAEQAEQVYASKALKAPTPLRINPGQASKALKAPTPLGINPGQDGVGTTRR